MSDCVVDASVVVDALVHDQNGELRTMIGQRGLHGPAHLEIEVVSAFRGLLAGAHVDEARIAAAIDDFYDLDVEVWPLGRQGAYRALQLRANLTAYDAAYVCCAEVLGLPLLTRDRGLARAAASMVEVVHL